MTPAFVKSPEPRQNLGDTSALHSPSSADSAFWYSVREPAAGSRWLLLGSELLQTCVLLWERRLGTPALLVLAGILAYNVVALVALRRVTFSRRAPLAFLLGVDLLLICIAALLTGASKSPFLGQFYLIIFAGGLFYGLPGGLATGSTAAVLTAALGFFAPDGLRQDVRDLIPYFPLTGILTGYLSSRLHAAMREQRAEAERARARTMQEQVRQREMELARTIQEAALVFGGDHPPVPFDVAVHRSFAQEVGGDFSLTFYGDENARSAPNALSSGDGSLSRNSTVNPPAASAATAPMTVAVAVGDVSGKGVQAALTANSIAYLLPWLHPLDDAPEALCQLNGDLARHLPGSAFVTLALAEAAIPANGAEGSLRVWSAGHPPAILWRDRTGKVETASEDGGGSVLGIFENWEKPTPWETIFEPGDVLVLYSDALIETHRTTDRELMGIERAAQLVGEYAPGRDARALTQKLAEAVADWGPQQDDLTILVCRYAP